MKIKITATISEFADVERLDVDNYYFGQSATALRLPVSFSQEEMSELVKIIHSQGKKAIVAVNALMSVSKMKEILPYLRFLEEIGVDQITVADPGIVYLLQKEQLNLPFIYDSAMFLTNAGQVNFWAKSNAVAALLARELPAAELEGMSTKLKIPCMIQVYGSTVIQHSKRNLLSNYFEFTNQEQQIDQEQNWYLIDPQDLDSHYSIFEDEQGTHIFASDDLNLIKEVGKLFFWNYHSWFLDGLYIPIDIFRKVVAVFNQARKFVEVGQYDLATATLLDEELRKLHPQKRTMSAKFFCENSSNIS